MSEQDRIVKHITENSIAIDNGIESLRTQIVKLKEYKAGLIDSAVTGKIKLI